MREEGGREGVTDTNLPTFSQKRCGSFISTAYYRYSVYYIPTSRARRERLAVYASAMAQWCKSNPIVCVVELICRGATYCIGA